MVVDNTPGSPQIISVRGNGTIVALAPAKVNFGSVPVGKTSPAETVTVTNAGGRTLNISNVMVQEINAGDFAQNSKLRIHTSPRSQLHSQRDVYTNQKGAAVCQFEYLR